MLRYILPLALILPLTAQADTVTVFAAASLKTALDRIASGWTQGHDDDIVISYGGSSALARQVINGAPADLFISASSDWMDAVEQADVLASGTRRDLLGNTLVIVGTKGTDAITPADLPQVLGESHLAMALVDSVPAGVYGKQALVHLGIWDSLAPKVAQADDVRAALALVATGEAHFGIVYASDAVAEPRVTQVAAFPDDSHDPITYPAALIEGHDTPEAQAFLEHLSSGEAAVIFRDEGFEVPE